MNMSSVDRVLLSPFDGVVTWAHFGRVAGDAPLIALRRLPPPFRCETDSHASRLSPSTQDVLDRAIASVSPRRDCGVVVVPRPEDVYAVATDLRAGVGAHRAARALMTPTERAAIDRARRGASDFELFAAVAHALVESDQLLRTTRSFERLLNM